MCGVNEGRRILLSILGAFITDSDSTYGVTLLFTSVLVLSYVICLLHFLDIAYRCTERHPPRFLRWSCAQLHSSSSRRCGGRWAAHQACPCRPNAGRVLDTVGYKNKKTSYETRHELYSIYMNRAPIHRHHRA
jgi:hypothetical protein